MAMNAAALETPSGKAARDENFPVGSILLPARLRPHVAAFYAFARAADDIADSPALAPEDRIARLDRLERIVIDHTHDRSRESALHRKDRADSPGWWIAKGDSSQPGSALAAALRGEEGGPDLAKAARMRASLEETAVSPRHCLDLLDAFRQDAVKARYADWDELMHYCDRSAAPVGRYLLDLHGEDGTLYPLSDALCNALQILNHLQDCAADHRELDRVYIPEPWLQAEGLGVQALAAARCDAALRRVLDRMLDGVDGLLATAAPLSAALTGRRLAMEAAAIQAVARKLSALLRRRDPLAVRVRLGRAAYASCIAEGVWKGLAR
jgi:phytoene/squalene synthetase